MELGFSGHPFTWTNRRSGSSFICERLDRALANIDWTMKFPFAKVYHLNASSSDHSPILLDFHNENRNRTKFFRYEIAWARNQSFSDFINNVWEDSDKQNKTRNFYDLYDKFRAKALWWKKHVHGNLDLKINEITDQIEELKNKLNFNYDEHLHQNIIDKEKEKLKLLPQKEIYWKQRAKTRWSNEGDNNTKFFHAYATNRKRRNCIQSLKINNEWIL